MTGKVGTNGFPVKVYGPDNQLVLETVAPEGTLAGHAIRVDDARTRQFTIFLKPRDSKDVLFVPLTTLPEVYRMCAWGQHQGTRFFTRSAGETPERIEIQPHVTPARILTQDLRVLAETEKGDPMAAEIGPKGAWMVVDGRYVRATSPVTFSVARDRWFAPDPDKLQLKPKPD